MRLDLIRIRKIALISVVSLSWYGWVTTCKRSGQVRESEVCLTTPVLSSVEPLVVSSVEPLVVSSVEPCKPDLRLGQVPYLRLGQVPKLLRKQ